MPHDATANITQEAEETLLGTLLAAPECVLDVDGIVAAEDFVDDRRAGIYVQLVNQYVDTGRVDLALIYKQSKSITDHITKLIDLASIPSNAIYYAQKVHDCAITRKVRTLCANMAKKFILPNDIQSEIARFDSEFLSIVQDQSQRKNPRGKNVVARWRERVDRQRKEGKRVYVKTGFRPLDQLLGGFYRGELWVIGAFTGIGKTTLMWEFVRRMYERNANPVVAVFSLEMAEQGNLLKLAANYTGIPASRTKDGHELVEDEEKKIHDAMTKVERHNLFFYDDIYDFTSIYLQARRIKRECNDELDVIFVDYVQNVQAPGTIYERMGGLAPKFRKMAAILDCNVALLSQLTDKGGKDGVKTRGADEIEHAADTVLLLSKERNELGMDTPERMLSIRKNRWGASERFPCRFANSYTRILLETEKVLENSGDEHTPF